MNTNEDGAKTADEADLALGRGRYWRLWADGFEFTVKGATGYRLRLIPSNKVLGTFPTARDAFVAYLAELDRGRRVGTLVVDWCRPDGTVGRVGAGRQLADLATVSVHGTKALAAARTR